ncbi:MAG: PAS domain-containing protein, partial [Alphaproteobacteria bacterium]
TMRDPILVLDTDLRIVSSNRAFYNTFGVASGDTEDCLVYDLGDGQWDIPALRELLEEILPHNSTFDDFEVTHDFPHIGRKTMLLNARKLYRPGNHTQMFLLAFEDVTKRRSAERATEKAHRELQDAYDREHKIATALQRPLTLETAEDAFPGVSVATLYEATYSEAEVGGDFFDVFALPREHVVCAVGDASGKGLSAAVRAMQVKDVLRAFAREYPHSASHVVARLNDYVHDSQKLVEGDVVEAFVCLVMAVVDPKTGEGTALSAGAEPPFILRANGDAEELSINGLPLGVSPQILYNTVPFRLEHGDTLILLTDGITEARNAKRQFLEHEGMLTLARAGQSALTLRDMGRAILNGAKQFANGILRDDACLVLVRRQ